MNLINLAVRMMPIFVCLDPKHSYRENIAAISAYLWVIMISMESVFHISPQVFFVFRGLFSCLYFLVLLVFLKGTLLKKGFLYISAWLFAVLSASLNEFAAWILKGHVSLTYGQICVAVSLLWACGFYGFVRFWLKRIKLNRLAMIIQAILFPAADIPLCLPVSSLLRDNTLILIAFPG